MEYRLMAVDMDGTLLNSKKEITPRTVEAVRKALDAGYEVVFSTGRSLSEVEQYLKLFPEMRYAILCSGAVVKDLRTGENLKTAAVEVEIAKGVVEASRGMEVNVLYFIGDGIYEAQSVRHKLDYYNCGMYRELHETCANWVEDPYAVMLERPEELVKINFYFHDEEEYRLMGKRLDEMGVSHPSGSIFNYEISAVGVSKAEGLQVLCDHLGISMEQAIACGDEGNDYEMIQAAGLGVAMGNAIEPIKAIADAVVADCDHDGVAEAIETYLGKPIRSLEGEK